MRRRSLLATLILILALALPVAVAADDPPGPTTRHQFRTAGLPVAGPAEMVTWVLDFAPGAATPPHTHPGLLLGTQLEGENTFTSGGADKVYKTGETLIELPGVVGIATNKGAVRNRALVSIVLPKGAPQSTAQPGAPAPALTPVTSSLFRADAVLPNGPYEVAQAVLDFAPGAQTPLHTHPGQTFVKVIEGAITFTSAGTTTVYQTGETFIEQPGVVVQARNAGTTRATVMATYLLPQGAPLSSPVAPAPPATGTGGNLPGLPNTGAGGGIDVPLGWLVPLAGGALAAGVLLLRRRARRA